MLVTIRWSIIVAFPNSFAYLKPLASNNGDGVVRDTIEAECIWSMDLKSSSGMRHESLSITCCCTLQLIVVLCGLPVSG